MLNILQSCKSSAVLQMCTVETTGYNSEAVSPSMPGVSTVC